MPLKMKVRNVLAAAMICAQVVGATGQAQAADRFVSTAGSDTANDCLTGASPCRTVAHGLARGEWGHVAAGGYRVAVVTGTLSRRLARPHQHGRSERPAVAVV